MASTDPGLQVFYSNRVERLAAQLALDLALYRGAEGVWKAASLVVPNANVKDYLRGSFAEAFGAVANLQFCYLEGFWKRYSDGRLLDRAGLLGSILSVLQDPDTRRDASLQPLVRYLEGAPEDLKAVQLGQRLAQHFERMLLHRPDWIRCWDQGLRAKGAEPEAVEGWQRALWRRLRRAWKGLAHPPIPLLDWMDTAAFEAAPFPDAVFLFGMSHMAPLFHHALAKVGTRASVRLYLVNPCEEPWDQDPLQRPFPSPTSEAPLEGEDPFQLQEPGEIILQRWARPAREQLRLLAGLAQGDFLGRFEEPEAPSLLAHLQQRILKPGIAETRGIERDDDSLRVVPCPSPRREAETVANLIWDLVQKSGGHLHFGDIAVLVPPAEQEAYQEHLGAAFRGAHGIPWAQALGASRALQERVEACLLLLDLAGGQLTRAELLRAAGHPFLQDHWGATPETWALLCDQAGIVAGLDAEETKDSYLEGGRWTWNEGLTRLALGCFVKDDEPIEAWGAMGRPLGRPEAPALLGLLGPLTSDLRALATGRFGLAAWQDRLELFLSTYLSPDPQEASEAALAAFQKIRSQLQKIGQGQVEGLPPVLLDFQALRPLVKAALEALLSDNALPPGRGVQVSCYTPLRAIPFQVLFLMGLGEGLFPGTERPDPLDLVASSPRRAGDVSRPEQDRQLFLEALLCTRQHLVCTYPSRSATTGEERQPSPLLLDLQEALGPELWMHAACPEQPLHRHDLSLFPELMLDEGDRPLPSVALRPPRAPHAGTGQSPFPASGLDEGDRPDKARAPFPCHLPAARQEAEAHWLGLQLRQEVGQRDLPRRLGDLGGSEALRRALAQRLGECGPIGEATPRLPSQCRITLKELRRWLECPVQGGVALRLGVQPLQDDEAAEVAEFPMDSGPLEQWGLLRRSFWAHAAGASELATGYDQVRRAAEGRAKVPIGALAAGERERHLALLSRWERLVGPTGTLRLPRFGSGLPLETQGLRVQEYPALTLGLKHPQGTTEVHLEGLGEPLCGDDFLLLSTQECTKEGPKDKARQESLRAWLSHLVLCALGDAKPRFARLHSAPNKGSDRVWRLPLPAVTPAEARRQLSAWCQELLVDGAQKLLPIEALLSAKPIPNLQDWIQDQQDGEEKATLSSFRGPVPRVKELPVDDLATGRQRLGPFLELQDHWEPL